MKRIEFKHVPVLAHETIENLNIKPNGIYVDGTLGGGGHSFLIAQKLKRGKLIGIDQDSQAIMAAKKKLEEHSDKVILIKENFRYLTKILNNLKIKSVDGILLDLGVSSFQLDNIKRGFSFRETEENLKIPLDMRMDPEQNLSAYEVVNRYPEEKLREILYKYGEEPFGRKIAWKIVQERQIKPIKTVGDLIEVIKKATPPKYRFSKKSHFASKTFRAIRMEVNSELRVVEEVIPQAIDMLKSGGRLAIITFHSLEDRIVKHTFREYAQNEIVKLVNKKPIIPSDEELEENPRAESAKLRVIEKL
jgi:16S rRNA (cytosine1402-N4)-methyltransferase